METIEKSQFNDQLRERTIQMAVVIVQLLKNRKVPPVFRPGMNQIIRSSSSVAANCRAAMRSRSDSEYFSKICIVVEECDETQFWLEYLLRNGVIKKEEFSEIFSEVNQLVRIFNAIKTKIKARVIGGR